MADGSRSESDKKESPWTMDSKFPEGRMASEDSSRSGGLVTFSASTRGEAEILSRPGTAGSVGSSSSVQKMDIREPLQKRHSQARLHGYTDPADLAEKIEQQLLKPEAYSVILMYKEEGWAQKVAKHFWFEHATLAVIVLNAVYIAVDTDWNKKDPLTPTNTNDLLDSHWFFVLMENFFCVYFTGEIVIRFAAFERKVNCFKDAWFVFDFFLVFLMVMETWLMPIILAASNSGGSSPFGDAQILRLLRLLRLSRLIRMLRSLPELMVLVKGMLKAITTVTWVMCLLIVTTYVFAIAFTILTADIPEVNEPFFVNVALSIYTLLIYGTFLDNLSVFWEALRLNAEASSMGWLLLPLALVYTAIAALTVMNMLIGVLCEIVDKVAADEAESIRKDNMVIKMSEVATSLDTNFNGKISYEEFEKIVVNPRSLNILVEVGVNPVAVASFAELFFHDHDEQDFVELTFEKFMELVLALRDENQATVKDLVALWMSIKTRLNERISELKDQLKSLEKRVDLWTGQIEDSLKILIQDLKDSLRSP